MSARHLARAHGPASSSPPPAGSPRKPEPRPGRRRACFSLLPVLALVLGALSLPAAAQTPTTPTHFEVTPGNAAFTVQWGSVTGANSYLIEWDANSATGFGNTAAATPGTARRKTIEHSTADPVVDGTLYKVRVRACSNANPLGATNLDCSGWTATLTVTPGTPGKVRGWSIGPGHILNGANSLRVSWDRVAANGSPLTGYDVHYTTSWGHSLDTAATLTYQHGTISRPDPATGWVEIVRDGRLPAGTDGTAGLAGGVTISPIPYGIAYRVRVRGVNAIGAGKWVEIGPYAIKEPVSPPNIARNMRVVPGNGKLILTWEAPSQWGSWTPGGYEVQWKLASAKSTAWAAVWKSGAPVELGPGATSFEFTGLQQGSVSVTNGTAYDLRMRPWNKRPGTDGSAANDRRATPHWYPSKVSGTPAAGTDPNDVITDRGVEVSATELGVSVGGSATYTVKLSAPPADIVAVTPRVADGTKASVSPTQLLFSQGDWDMAQTVTVSGAAAGETSVSHSISTQDPEYRFAIAPTVKVTVSQASQQGTNPNAALISQMREWRNDPQWVSYKAHTDRWDRALLALGETVSDNTLTPMTAAEAQAFVDQGWTRWVDVAAALAAKEAGESIVPDPQDSEQPNEGELLVPPALHASLITDMYEWRNDPQWVSYKAHTDRWDRALLAFGETIPDNTLTPMTDSEAQGFADRGWTRWVDVAAALKTVVTGTSSADTLRGTNAGELLVGLGGADTLSGQGGSDELRGGNGGDTYTGGADADRFVFFSTETGANAITDFESGDVIVLEGNGWRAVADIIASVQAAGSGNYRYTLASGLTVETTNNRSLRTEDFLVEAE